jgi:proteasome lid subunit RPN8/RPN11
VIRLPKRLYEEIAHQAENEMPNECCGYLAGTKEGDGRLVVKRIPMTNVDASPEHFSFDPKEQFAALKAARESGLELIANYHSHPETPARMSEEDIRLANDRSIRYLIYSVKDATLKAFAVDGTGDVTEEVLTITSEKR